MACVIGLSILQSNNNDTRICVFVEACLLRPQVIQDHNLCHVPVSYNTSKLIENIWGKG